MTGPRSLTFDSTYPMPLQIERDAGSRRYLLSNRGQQRRDRVTLSLLGSGSARPRFGWLRQSIRTYPSAE